MTPARDAAAPPLQPLLDDAVIVLRAPTQVWSGRYGDLGAQAIDGVYHGDVRHIHALHAACRDSSVEWISTAPHGPSRVVFSGLLRGLDDPTPDPKVRITRDRRVADGSMTETWTVRSRLPEPIDTVLELTLDPEFASLHDVKAGIAQRQPVDVQTTDAAVTARSGVVSFTLTAEGAALSADVERITAQWPVHVDAGGEASVSFTVALHDASLVVHGAAEPWAGGTARREATREPRLDRWLDVALGDLDALRLTTSGGGGDEFFAAGAPWFFTLFGRDSLWAARLVLPLDAGVAASTLRALAAMQGTQDDPTSAQEPGKILHELRSSALEIPHEGVVLPPQYYGSVDSTPLWVCLLADAWRAGMPDAEVRDLLPALRGALRWILEFGDSDGDGFLDYIDRSGRGLANQGWKDSGDSIQWRDGSLAEGPIALCEVQGYAYEAARAGADLLAEFGGADEGALAPEALRAWAAELRERFRAAYWVRTPEGRYPAIALDRHKRPVDALTSNIGHLIGTGILDPHEEIDVADLLAGPSMTSGYGIRTMSTGAAGYWPLSYHGGSVWTHDTAIIARGLHRAGLASHASAVAEGLLAAADGFAYRVPELHAGDPASQTSVPTPYPAACRPQAWSAAAAVVCLEILT
ncbi:glycogen debranching N-terminal domain-containing protein [Microbacterium sp. Root180]|uniref:glycogen debranching N-terminal domain-containing protein n=1 Tax=Microbacterium sp. Root180 TaxID=1736483 RepID=UPI0006F2171F|nr:glycogen debranching N-terminal domain-containing protein [Microbacterium sp. Root180]KRB38962.1 amylo-alpha-1,6-glucosidase [Microbacterium sp. Root180]